MALPLLPETEILGILSQLEIIGEKPLSVFSSGNNDVIRAHPGR